MGFVDMYESVTPLYALLDSAKSSSKRYVTLLAEVINAHYHFSSAQCSDQNKTLQWTMRSNLRSRSNGESRAWSRYATSSLALKGNKLTPEGDFCSKNAHDPRKKKRSVPQFFKGIFTSMSRSFLTRGKTRYFLEQFCLLSLFCCALHP